MSDESIGGVLDNLVNQFADPLAFLRELIQNALDAGSAEIDVWMEFREGNGDQGVMVIGVDDYGEGMDREIIEKRLVRLFSSAKDGDMTKIGKFGIGFVSVFAIKPDAVFVNTCRANESLQIFFKADRSHKISRLTERIEGTKIQVVKAATGAEYDDYEQRVLDTVTFWCKHVQAEIRFQGESINQPLSFDAAVTARYQEQGTDVVVAYGDKKEGFVGFYNKGLTLLEERGSEYPYVDFKVSSRYLEHTLSRDDVVKDRSYKKAIKIVDRLVTEDLRVKLFEAIDARVRAGKLEAIEPLYQLVRHHFRQGDKIPSAANDFALLPSVSNKPLTVSALLKARDDKKLTTALTQTALTDVMEAEGFAVVARSSAGSDLATALSPQGLPHLEGVYCTTLPVTDPTRRATWKPLHFATKALLEAHSPRLSELSLAHFTYPRSEIVKLVAITLAEPEPGKLSRVDEVLNVKSSVFSKKRSLVVNADHPTVIELEKLAEREPEFAAYTLVKLFFLNITLDPELDARLGEISAERRCKRLMI